MQKNNYNSDQESIFSNPREHNYVNLNQTYSGAKPNSKNGSHKPSLVSANYYNNNIHNINNASIISPKNNYHSNNNINSNIEDWFSPMSSIKSNSRPPSLIIEPPVTHRTKKSSVQRLTSIASSNNSTIVSNNTKPKLNAIDENPLSVNDILNLCQHSSPVVKINALAYLQHRTFQNQDMKLEIVNCNGLRTILDLCKDINANISVAALGVLKNVSYIEVDIVANGFKQLDGIMTMVTIIERSSRHSQEDKELNEDLKQQQQELAIDVIWNLSTKQDMKALIVRDVVDILVEEVVIPSCGLQREPSGHYSLKKDLDDVSGWSALLRNALGIIRNISYNDLEVRMKLRRQAGLMDTLFTLLHQVSAVETIPELQAELLDHKIVQNTMCILRNLTFALQEVVDRDYGARIATGTKQQKKTAPQFTVPVAAGGHPRGIELLWDSMTIVSRLAPILTNATDAITLEAATGIIQNLTAGDWQPSVLLREQVRLQKLLPVLVELVVIGTNDVIRSSATALRNVIEDPMARQLVATNQLASLVQRIPLDQHEFDQSEQKLGNSSLAAILTVIYIIIKDNEDFMKHFVSYQGIRRCMFVRDSSEFVDVPYSPTEPGSGDKVRYFSQCIMQLFARPSTAMQKYIKQQQHQQQQQLNNKQPTMNNALSSSSSTVIENPDVAMNELISPDKQQQLQQQQLQQLQPQQHVYANARYSQDYGGSELISNPQLQQRNSTAYTTSAIPGYGDVRIPNVSVRQSNASSITSSRYNPTNQRPPSRHSHNRPTNDHSNSNSMNPKIQIASNNHSSINQSPRDHHSNSRSNTGSRVHSNTGSYHNPRVTSNNKIETTIPHSNQIRTDSVSTINSVMNHEYARPHNVLSPPQRKPEPDRDSWV